MVVGSVWKPVRTTSLTRDSSRPVPFPLHFRWSLPLFVGHRSGRGGSGVRGHPTHGVGNRYQGVGGCISPGTLGPVLTPVTESSLVGSVLGLGATGLVFGGDWTSRPVLVPVSSAFSRVGSYRPPLPAPFWGQVYVKHRWVGLPQTTPGLASKSSPKHRQDGLRQLRDS